MCGISGYVGFAHAEPYFDDLTDGVVDLVSVACLPAAHVQQLAQGIHRAGMVAAADASRSWFPDQRPHRAEQSRAEQSRSHSLVHRGLRQARGFRLADSCCRRRPHEPASQARRAWVGPVCLTLRWTAGGCFARYDLQPGFRNETLGCPYRKNDKRVRRSIIPTRYAFGLAVAQTIDTTSSSWETSDRPPRRGCVRCVAVVRFRQRNRRRSQRRLWALHRGCVDRAYGVELRPGHQVAIP